MNDAIVNLGTEAQPILFRCFDEREGRLQMYAQRTADMQWTHYEESVSDNRGDTTYCYELLPFPEAQFLLARIDARVKVNSDMLNACTDVVHLRYAARIQEGL